MDQTNLEKIRAFKPDIPADAHMMLGKWGEWAWAPYEFISEKFNRLGGVCFDVLEYAGEKITESTMDYGDSHNGITDLKLHKRLPQYSE